MTPCSASATKDSVRQLGQSGLRKFTHINAHWKSSDFASDTKDRVKQLWQSGLKKGRNVHWRL